LARQKGIQTEYVDMAGKVRRARQETLKAVLDLWGLSAANARDALRAQALSSWRQPLEPVVVAWDRRPARLQIKMPAEFDEHRMLCRLHYEGGRCANLESDPEQLPVKSHADLDGRAYLSRELTLPPLPFGYHELEVEFRGRNHRALLISSPTRSYLPEREKKSWGVFLPVYAARTARGWGAGDLGDWRRLTDWAAALGANTVATLPLLAAFLDSPRCEPSPYSPASRLFWNDFYLDVEAMPEFAASRRARQLFESPRFQRALASLRQSTVVDYCRAQRLRRQVLECAARDFFGNESPRHKQFEQFLQDRPAVKDYAEFRAACDQSGQSWHLWDERMRNGKLQKGDFSAADRDYHLFVQWLVQDQVSRFVEHSGRRGMRLYLDLPIGVSSDSYDLWRERDAFAFRAATGAPPDLFFTKGQNWGFAPLHPHRIRDRKYAYVLDYLRFQMRHAGVLRIDHVMGLHRLYWIPPGFPAAEGAYVTYPAEELYAILSLESHRHKCVLVGENLGTVPPEVNDSMVRHGLRQTYVLQYEQRPDLKSPLRPPPAKSAASINTHDMPTFEAHWRGLDIDDRRALGLVSRRAVELEKRRRGKLNRALAGFLKRKGFLKTVEPAGVLIACLAWLAAGPAELVLVNLEDLWGETRPQNVPGTSTERANWQHKAKLTLEEFSNSRELCDFLAELDRLRRE
jgi:4-alpha-glucanotransferase